MSKRVPMRKILKLVNEVQETLTRPDVDVEFLLRGRYSYDGEGDVEVEMGAEAPVPVGGVAADVEVGVGWSRHWTAVGVGEFVLRVSRVREGAGSPPSPAVVPGTSVPAPGPPWPPAATSVR